MKFICGHKNTGQMHVRYFLHFSTGQIAKIADCPVKYRTCGNPSNSLL